MGDEREGLRPQLPTNLAATRTREGVALQWDVPTRQTAEQVKCGVPCVAIVPTSEDEDDADK